MALVFWARRFSPASTRFSNTFLKVLLSLLRMANVGCRLDQGPVGKNYGIFLAILFEKVWPSRDLTPVAMA
jgi:hypothetical protein